MLASRVHDTLKNLQQLDTSKVFYNGLGAKFQTKRFQLGSLEIGPLSYKHVVGSIFVDFSADFTADPEGIQKDPNYIAQKQLQRDLDVTEEDMEDYSLSKGIDYHFDGIIGRDLFENYITILDYTQNKITLIQSNPKLDISKQIAENEELLETEADFTRGALYLYFNVAGEKYQFCLDTGATNSSFRYDPYLLNCLYKPHELRVVPIMKDLKTTEDTYIDVQQFDIHDCHKINCDGFLGYDFICNKKILLDFPNQKVYLRKVD